MKSFNEFLNEGSTPAEREKHMIEFTKRFGSEFWVTDAWIHKLEPLDRAFIIVFGFLHGLRYTTDENEPVMVKSEGQDGSYSSTAMLEYDRFAPGKREAMYYVSFDYDISFGGSPGDRGSYWEPPSGGEEWIESVSIDDISYSEEGDDVEHPVSMKLNKPENFTGDIGYNDVDMDLMLMQIVDETENDDMTDGSHEKYSSKKEGLISTVDIKVEGVVTKVARPEKAAYVSSYKFAFPKPIYQRIQKLMKEPDVILLIEDLIIEKEVPPTEIKNVLPKEMVDKYTVHIGMHHLGF